MKKLFSLSLLALSLASFASVQEDNNELTKATIEEFIASDYRDLTLPREDKKRFYTYCSSFQLALVVGYESGLCVGMSLDSKGKIEYAPIKLRNWKVSWGAGIELHEGNLHQIRGIDTLEDIYGYYLIGSSGAGFIANVRSNWFTLKLSLKDLVGNRPEFDGGVPVLNVGLDIISLGLMNYKKIPGTKVQSLQLSKAQLNRISLK